MAAACLLALSCTPKSNPEEFRYSLDEFADLEVIRYQVPGWDELTFGQKQYIYYLSEAAKYGRDIIWEQNYVYNLPIRKALEKILTTYDGGDRGSTLDWYNFLVYAKRVFFSNGIHHHYGEHKFFPECPRKYMEMLFDEAGCDKRLIEIMYNPDIAPFRKYQGEGVDLIKASANHLYEGVSRKKLKPSMQPWKTPTMRNPCR